MKIEQVETTIKLLEEINPIDEFAYEKAILAYRNINNFPILSDNIPASNALFRTRLHEENNLFQKISDISLAPQSSVKNFARCNRPFQSKFYCSENRPTSYAELAKYVVETKKVGEKIYVTIGEWLLKKPLTLFIISSPEKERHTSRTDRLHGQTLQRFIDNSNSEIKETTTCLYRYLFDKFRKQSKDDLKTYIITTAFCNLSLIHSKDNVNGICYPSVPFCEQGINLSINSNFITFENIELTQVIRNELTVCENENGNLSFRESGKIEASKIDIENNTILW